MSFKHLASASFILALAFSFSGTNKGSQLDEPMPLSPGSKFYRELHIQKGFQGIEGHKLFFIPNRHSCALVMTKTPRHSSLRAHDQKSASERTGAKSGPWIFTVYGYDQSNQHFDELLKITALVFLGSRSLPEPDSCPDLIFRLENSSKETAYEFSLDQMRYLK